jgi:DNA helicase II / ATP-dependent DNA helicase PcrA
MSLTNQQKKAVSHAVGNLQLIACAGSGKTEVVAQHITKLLTEKKDGGGGLCTAGMTEVRPPKKVKT